MSWHARNRINEKNLRRYGRGQVLRFMWDVAWCGKIITSVLLMASGVRIE